MKRKIGIILCVYLFSCSDFEKEDQSARVDSLIGQVEGIEKAFLKIKIDSISALQMSTYEVERQIKQNYSPDSINLVIGKKMNDYKRMRKMLGPLGKEEARLKVSLIEEKEQLVKLGSDILNGYGKRELYNEYIDFETKKVNQIKTLYEEYDKTRAQFLEIYQRLHNELIAFSARLRAGLN
tara:strand:+ start:382 stop:924 length:543 start_codon:yes stop_codon:yes gene_type:complete